MLQNAFIELTLVVINGVFRYNVDWKELKVRSIGYQWDNRFLEVMKEYFFIPASNIQYKEERIRLTINIRYSVYMTEE